MRKISRKPLLVSAPHFVKSVRSRSFPGQYFPTFRLNSLNVGKYGPESSDYGHFSRSDPLVRNKPLVEATPITFLSKNLKFGKILIPIKN